MYKNLPDSFPVTPSQLADLIADAYRNDYNRLPDWSLLDEVWELDAEVPPATIEIHSMMLHSTKNGIECDIHRRSAIYINGVARGTIDNSFEALRRLARAMKSYQQAA